MSFVYPWVLLALGLPLLLLVHVWRRSGRGVAMPFDHGAAWPRRVLVAALRTAESLPALVLGVAVVMLAGPQELAVPKTRRALTNIEFCVDVSGSMAAKFGDGTRYEASMKAIDAFLDVRKGDAFGLTFFAENPLHWVPLTSDASAFRCATPFMGPGRDSMGVGSGTEIGKALFACRKVLLERETGDRMIVLVTDGASADLGGDRNEEVARKLKADGIVLYAIHIADEPIPDDVLDIARWTGGDFFDPQDQQALQAAFRHIDKMQTTKLEKEAAELVDAFSLWCVVGLSLLGLHALLQLGLRHTPW
ncbi:MAG: vWA domain-containing protein [Planctomycetota bacterium]